MKKPYIFWFFLLFSLANALVHHHEHKPASRNLLKRGKCSNADEVPTSFIYGYVRGNKNDNNKNTVLRGLNEFKTDSGNRPGQQSFMYKSGNVNGYMWIGSMIQNSGFSQNILPLFINEVKSYGIPNTGYIEYANGDPMKTFGVIWDTTNNFGNVQKAVRNWSKGKPYGTKDANKNWKESVCYYSYANRKAITNNANDQNAGNCEYIQVKSGMNLASATGVNGESLQGYNPNLDFSKLQPGQPVCYTIGKLPNFKPSKNSDGSCKVYKVSSGDSCSSITAKYYPLSINDINNYNKQNFGWTGCDKLQKDYNLCVSDGTPPKPTINPKAECGPQSSSGANCPLNACCSEFGFCGLTKEFCEKKTSLTGAPGTSGCLSNCGYGSLPSARSSFSKITYWLDTDDEMAMDPTQLKNGPFDKVHYAFVNINSDLSIDDSKISDSPFLDISQKKIASFGGWDFSTSTSTYQIFRNAVQSGNRDKFANNLVNFLKKYNLDGIDLDWEYPGAPDIPGIPADDKNNGNNYLELLKLLKNKLPSGKTLSVALPASYWYLKGFPVKDMQNYVDYFVYMTYDMHGSWEYGKANTWINCHTNKQDITDSLKMLNKAGVDFSKVYGGLANYGRSYKLSNNNCYGIGCLFAGPGNSRDMTNTPGVLSDSEIIDIDSSSSKNTRWNDGASACTFMKYDGNSVVSWPTDRNSMENFLKNSGLAGSVLWVNNYFKHTAWDKYSTDDNDDVFINCEDKDDLDFSKLCQIINKKTKLTSPTPSIGKINYVAISLNVYNNFVGTIQNMNGYANFVINQKLKDFKDSYKHVTKLVSITNYFINNINDFSSKYDESKIDLEKGLPKEYFEDPDFYTYILSKKMLYSIFFGGTGLLTLKTTVEEITNIFDIADNKKSSGTLGGFKNKIIKSAIQDAYNYLKDKYTVITDSINDMNYLYENNESYTYDLFDIDPSDNELPYTKKQNKNPDLTTKNTNKLSKTIYDICNGDNNCISKLKSIAIDLDKNDSLKAIIEQQKKNDPSCKTPYYIVNINNESPGVACNALNYLSKNLDKIPLIFTKKDSNKSRKDRNVLLGHYKRCGGISESVYPAAHGKPYEKDEFPFSSVKEGDYQKSSILCVNKANNTIDGLNLYKFYIASGKSEKTDINMSLKVRKNDFRYCFPNTPSTPIRAGRIKTDDQYNVLINFDGNTDCSKHGYIPEIERM